MFFYFKYFLINLSRCNIIFGILNKLIVNLLEFPDEATFGKYFISIQRLVHQFLILSF